jgi:hypothetical protein
VFNFLTILHPKLSKGIDKWNLYFNVS